MDAPRFTIQLQGAPDFSCGGDEPVLVALAQRRLGLLRGRVIQVAAGCRTGRCGICRVQVLEGSFRMLPRSAGLITEAEEVAGVILACRLLPCSDLRLRPLAPPPWWKPGPRWRRLTLARPRQAGASSAEHDHPSSTGRISSARPRYSSS